MADVGWWGNLSNALPALTTLAGMIAAILAWVAKLRWSKEFAAAKDEALKAKDAEIAALKTQVGNLTNAHAELVKAKDAEIAALRTQSGAVSLAKDETIKAKEAQIAAIQAQIIGVGNAKDEAIKLKDAQIAVIQSQISSLTNSHEQVLKAKDEKSVVLEREIQSLRELSPTRLRENYKAVVDLLNETSEAIKKELEKELEITTKELESKGEQIRRLESEGMKNTTELEMLEKEKELLEKDYGQLLILEEGLNIPSEESADETLKLEKYWKALQVLEMHRDITSDVLDRFRTDQRIERLRKLIEASLEKAQNVVR